MFHEPELHCFMSGVPHNMWVQFGQQTLQTKDYVVFNWEFMHSRRIIPLDNRPHQITSPAVHLFQGESVGHWDGDTLVVDTTNQNDKTWFDTSGHYKPEDVHVVERFTMTDSNTIDYEADVDLRRVHAAHDRQGPPDARQRQRSELRADGVRLHRGQRGSCSITPKTRAEKPRTSGPDAVRQSSSRVSMKVWLCFFAAATLAFGQTAYKAPRTSEGKPDLSGIWFTQSFAAAWDIEDHPTAPNIVGGPSILIDPPDKKIPYQAWGPAKRKDLIENHAFDDPQAHCYPSGIPRVAYAPFGFEITQSSRSWS